MAVADRHGLPIAVGVASGERAECKLVVETLDARFVEEAPRLLIGDRAYDSDPLREELAGEGFVLLSPHRSNRTKAARNDGPRMRRYKRRWIVERTMSWLHSFRRLIVRLLF